MPLGPIRKKIDTIDAELIRLLNERADHVHEVGVIKKRDGLQIYAPDREQKLLNALTEKNQAYGGRLPDEAVHAIYREIMSAALALEEDLQIAYLGPEGTWTHQAAITKFGHSVKYTAQPNFEAVFDQVARRKANYGVVPIENSTEGAVNHTLDLFAESPLKICAQILLRIENALMSKEKIEDIDVIYSHPQVFGQCRKWLHEHFPKADLVEVSSTGKAAEIAARTPRSAAMGGALSGEINGLTVLENSVQDSATNTTRFLVLSEETCPPTGDDRTSLMFSVRNQPGSLIAALSPFSDFALNMSKIESRPSKQRDWEYFFFVDVIGHCEDDMVLATLKELDSHCSFVKILGSYPNTGA